MARVVTSAAPSVQYGTPQRAWVIVELGWEHNDEFTCAERETPLTQLFFDKALADTECQRLSAEFFAAETPVHFEADFATYFDEATHRGFPDPYYVLELGASELRGTS